MKAIAIIFSLLSLITTQAFAVEQFKNEQTALEHCDSGTVTWLNLRTGAIHFKGQHWYGRTKYGAYVCQQKSAKEGRSATRNENAAQAEWVKVIGDEAADIYVSPSTTLGRNGDNVKILSMNDLKRPAKLGDEKPFLSWKTQYEFDCKKEQSRILAASMHSGHMGKGETTNRLDFESPMWEVIAPGSNGEALWEFACGKE